MGIILFSYVSTIIYVQQLFDENDRSNYSIFYFSTHVLNLSTEDHLLNMGCGKAAQTGSGGSFMHMVVENSVLCV